MKNLWPKMALLTPVTMEKYDVWTVSKIFRLPFKIFQSWTCMNNAGLDERDTLLWMMRHGKLKLLSTWIIYMSRGASGAKGPSTRRHRRIFSWKSWPSNFMDLACAPQLPRGCSDALRPSNNTPTWIFIPKFGRKWAPYHRGEHFPPFCVISAYHN